MCDSSFMERCIALAQKGLGYTYPNPMVGCVIVHDGKIIAEGWHKKAGKSHAEREAISKKSGTEDANDFALQLMIEKALDKEGKRLFADGDKASLRREVAASVLQEIQLAMLEAGSDKEVEEAKADLKS